MEVIRWVRVGFNNKICLIMKIYQLIFLITILTSLIEIKSQLSTIKDPPQLNYTDYKQLYDDFNTLVAFTPDYTLCIFYGRNDSYTLGYTPYNWKVFNDTNS
jgi:hypothetical protein